MPSFDISSELDLVKLRNAVYVTSRQITNRYDFKGTSAKIEFLEKDSLITLYGDSEFQLDQIKSILLPAMEKQLSESSKRLDHQDIHKISGNKVKQELRVKSGIDSELAKKIVRLIKDSGYKVQANIQGDAVRVSGNKRDMLQAVIRHVEAAITDYPLQFGNFRD